MFKKFIYSLEGRVSSTKIGILITTISSALLVSDLPESWDFWLKLIAILGVGVTGNGIRDALSKIMVSIKEAIDKIYKDSVKN